MPDHHHDHGVVGLGFLRDFAQIRLDIRARGFGAVERFDFRLRLDLVQKFVEILGPAAESRVILRFAAQAGGDARIALAGRSVERLRGVRDTLGESAQSWPL